MAAAQRVGRAVLEITTDHSSYDQGIAEVKASQQQLKQTWKSIGGDIRVISRQVGMYQQDFGGAAFLQRANAMATAVERIGGVTKLTTSEKVRLNSVLEQSIEKYRVLGQQAPKAMVDLAAATRAVTPQLAQVDRAAGLLKSTFGQAFAGFTLANVATRSIYALGSALVAAADRGARFSALSPAFDRLTASVNQSADAMLTRMHDATFGLVSDLDLMQSANKAVLLGLPVTAKEMSELARAAVVLGRAMGQDATKSLDDLITALGRSSPLILDNLGLTVKVGEANDAYARSLGKSAADLTQAEQKMAFYRAAMEAARKKTADLGEQQMGVSEQWHRLTTAVDNYTTSAAAGVNQSSSLSGGLGLIADAADRAARRMDDLAEARKRVFGDAPQTLREAQQQFGAGSDPRVQRELDRIVRQHVFEKARDAAPNVRDFLPLPGGPGVNGPTDAEVRDIEASSEKIKAAIEKTKREVDQATDAFREYVARLRGDDLQKAASDFVKGIAEIGGVGKLTATELDQFEKAVAAAVEKMHLAEREVPRSWEVIANGVKSSGLLQATEEQLGKSLQMVDRFRTQLLLTSHSIAGLSTATPVNIASQGIGAPISEELKARAKEWADFSASVKRDAGAMWQQTGGSLATLLFGNRGDHRAAEFAVQQAKDTYERIRRSGTSSAEQLTAAFDRYQDAVEARNNSMVPRWEQVWQSIKSSTLRILDDILKYFLESFLKRMIAGAAGAKLGESLFGGGSGSGGGGGAGIVESAAKKYGARLFGGSGGGAVATVGSGAGSVTASGGAVAAGDTVYGTGLAGVGGGAAGAGGTGTGAGAAGAGGGGAAAAGVIAPAAGGAVVGAYVGAKTGSAKKGAASGAATGAAIGAFFGPIGLAVGAGVGALAGWIGAKAAGGEEGVKVNPFRDKFFAQFGPPGWAAGSGRMVLAATLTTFGAGAGGGSLFAAMNKAKKEKTFHSAEDNIISFLAQRGIGNIKKYNFGGFVPPGVVQPAILHGGRRGELIVPLDRANQQTPQTPSVMMPPPVIVNVGGICDRDSIQEIFQQHIVPLFKSSLRFNQHGIATDIERHVFVQ